MGVAEQAGSPQGQADEVRLVFQLFDGDFNGVVSTEELRGVLQSLDRELWTDERITKLVDAYDTSGDGELQFSEFWGWICGHGGIDTADFKPALMQRAVERDRDRRAVNEEKAARGKAAREAREAKEAEAAMKAEQREAGVRMARAEFIKQQMAVGVSEEAARKMFSAGDGDNDGEIDMQERQWLANDTSATTKQIRAIYQSGAGNVDAKGNLVVKQVDVTGMGSLIQAFSRWDKDGDGTISHEELARVLRTLNPKMGDQTVQTLAKEIDSNKDGVIDIMEFIGWLSGESSKKKKMKQKAKQEQETRIGLAMHKKRAEEARSLKLQAEFEQAQHARLETWIRKKKIKATCNTLLQGPGAPQICTKCYNRHTWVCHGCGFVSFYDDCVNGCSSRDVGWTCINGKCPKKNCGCKKKPEHWQKYGCTSDVNSLSLDVQHIIDASTSSASPPA